MPRILLVVLTTLLVAACSTQRAQEPPQSQAEEQALAVGIATAQSRQVARTISVTGSLQPEETATLSNEVAGALAAVHVDFGQTVRKGQVVAEIDQRELRLQLEQIQAALTQSLARIGLSPDEAGVVPESTPAIRQAQAQVDNARTKYESAAKLIQSGDIANDRYVELEKAYHAAEAGLDAARHELRVALANIESLRAQVKLAEKRLADAMIRAPFEGAVTERMASPGEYLRENSPILRIVKTNPLRLRVDVQETAAAAVKVGTDLSFTTDAIPGVVFNAVVREIDPSLDPRSRSLSAEARLTRSDPRLRPGMFVQVQLVVDSNATIVVVPKEAVRTVAGLTKLFTVENGQAVERKVLLGREFDGWVEVRDGVVREGETVAVDHLAELVDGMKVSASARES